METIYSIWRTKEGYSMHVPGVYIGITDSKFVSIIEKAISEARRIDANVERYVQYVLEEEGLR